jgi:hypothetical protein
MVFLCLKHVINNRVNQHAVWRTERYPRWLGQARAACRSGSQPFPIADHLIGVASDVDYLRFVRDRQREPQAF